MPYIKQIQSITNRANAGGPKKAGKPDHAEFSRIPYNIFKSKTPKNLIFDSAGYARYQQTQTGEQQEEDGRDAGTWWFFWR